MKRLLLLPILLTNTLFSEFNYHISTITPEVKARMVRGNSWRESCPVPLIDLRYVNLNYLNFEGETRSGEIIVHKEVADEVVAIFSELYRIGYPIRQMRLVSDFNANDWQSIDADNTSAFNCRAVTGNKKKWSKHAYGRAIDLNPLENPYLSHTGHISHKGSLQYRQRRHKNNTPNDHAVLLKYDKTTQIFKTYGWSWGGDWRTIKDYQHFVKR